MKNNFKFVAIAFFIATLYGCTAVQLGAYTIPKDKVNSEYTKVYEFSRADGASIINQAIKDLGWVKLEEHKNILTKSTTEKISWKIRTKNALDSDYMYTWSSVSPEIQPDDLVFIKVRTPMTWVSGGASIFIGISTNDNKTTIKISGSTTQIVEKEKLGAYIESIITKVDLLNASA